MSAQVDSYNDLHGKRVGTTSASTSADFLEQVRIDYRGFDSLGAMFAALEAGELDAVVHDAPILAFYAAYEGRGRFELKRHLFRSEKYGVAMITGHWAKPDSAARACGWDVRCSGGRLVRS